MIGRLEAQGLSTTVADLRFAKPLDSALIRKLCASHEVVVTVEEKNVGSGASPAPAAGAAIVGNARL